MWAWPGAEGAGRRLPLFSGGKETISKVDSNWNPVIGPPSAPPGAKDDG